MTPDRFATLLDAYGADPARWPPGERDAALAHAAATPAAAALLDAARRLDALIDRLPADAPAPDLARLAALAAATAQEPADNVVALRPRATRPRPAATWARAAALAAAGICGLIVGMGNVGELTTHNTANASVLELYDAGVVEEIGW